jgi:hypothetical protein
MGRGRPCRGGTLAMVNGSAEGRPTQEAQKAQAQSIDPRQTPAQKPEAVVVVVCRVGKLGAGGHGAGAGGAGGGASCHSCFLFLFSLLT